MISNSGYDHALGREVRDPSPEEDAQRFDGNLDTQLDRLEEAVHSPRDTRTSEDPRPWQFTDLGLIILSGITWDEWAECWQATAGLHRRSMFYLGDCLNSGEMLFGERYAQVVGGHSVETIRAAMWVAKRIPPDRRRQVSFSHHRAVAALDQADQDELLAQAEADGWTTIDMRAAVKARKAELAGTHSPPAPGYPSNGGPTVGVVASPAAVSRQPHGPEVTGSEESGDDTFESLLRERSEIRDTLARWWRRWTAARRAQGDEGDPGIGLVQIDDWARELPDPRYCAVDVET